jgi:hypothetical protein
MFGSSVSIIGDSAIIGANDNDSKGAAYIFTRNGTSWSQEVKLTASDGESGDEFGCAVSISGDSVIVGAQSDDDENKGIVNSGSAYIYTKFLWAFMGSHRVDSLENLPVPLPMPL